MANITIIHGIHGDPQENWFPWMKNRLESIGHTVTIPHFSSTPENLAPEHWMSQYREETKSHPTEILVAHSLGVPVALHILESHKMKAAFLIAGASSVPNNQFKQNFVTFIGKGFNWESIKSNVSHIAVYHSDNDPYIPLTHGQETADNLSTDLTFIPSAGHFNKAAGYTEFPELLDYIEEVLGS